MFAVVRCRSARYPLPSILTLALFAAAPAAHAQRESIDLAAAGRAFQRGQRAQLRREYVHAAELFELADEAAPTAAALRSAIRNWTAAHNIPRAATLAMHALERYPNDAGTVRLAAGIVTRRGPSLALLRLRCTPACLLSVDGRSAASAALAKHDLYLPRGEHVVVADYGDGRVVQQRVAIGAGQVRELALQPASEAARHPPASEAERPAAIESARPAAENTRPVAFESARPTIYESARATATESARRPADDDDERPLATATERRPAAEARLVAQPAPRDRRLPPIAPVIGAVLTLGLGAALAWSVNDTLSARDRYVEHPTAAGYRDGVAREAAMDGLIGGVAGLGAVTIAVALFATNWHARFAGGGPTKLRVQRAWPTLSAGAGVFTVGVTAPLD